MSPLDDGFIGRAFFSTCFLKKKSTPRLTGVVSVLRFFAGDGVSGPLDFGGICGERFKGRLEQITASLNILGQHPRIRDELRAVDLADETVFTGL